MTIDEVEDFMLFGGRVDYHGAVYHVIAVNRLNNTVKLSREYDDNGLTTAPVENVSKHVFKEDGKN